MRVKATKGGFYGGARRRAGDVFDIRDSPLPPDTPEAELEAKAEAAKNKPARAAAHKTPAEAKNAAAKKQFPHDFSEKWMEPVSADTPAGSVKDRQPEGRPADQREADGKAKAGAKADRSKAGPAGRKSGHPARPAAGAKKGEHQDATRHGEDLDADGDPVI